MQDSKRELTALIDDMASITSFVNCFPTPDVPINIDGLIACVNIHNVNNLLFTLNEEYGIVSKNRNNGI